MTKLEAYDPKAKLPKVGTRWVWEIDQAHARALIEVTEVIWNGEEWWVRSKSMGGESWPESLLPKPGEPEGGYLNDLDRFWQAATPIGGPITARVYEQVDDPATREPATA